MIPFDQRLRDILFERNIPIQKFGDDTGINRENFFYRKSRGLRKRCRYIYMAIAYYLDVRVEDMIAGTTAEIDWYGDAGI